MSYSITRNGKCVKHLCVIDEKVKAVSTVENGLVFDFSGEMGWSFKAGHSCHFKSGSDCSYITGYGCVFRVGNGCMFRAGDHCVFTTGYGCIFKAGSHCKFLTGYGCSFNTYAECSFKTGSDCTFNTNYKCIFKVGDNCVLIRKDVNGVTKLPVDKLIELKGYEVSGYVELVDSKQLVLNLSGDQVDALLGILI
jgi:hypothetical protein